MLVRMLATAAGPVGVFTAGETYALSETLGAAFVAVGAAVRLDAPVEAETVETPEDGLPPVERAVTPAGKKRK